jgi:hypothetical protein
MAVNIRKAFEFISCIIANALVWFGLLFLFVPWLDKIIELKTVDPLSVVFFIILFLLSLPFYIFGVFTSVSMQSIYLHILYWFPPFIVAILYAARGSGHVL